MFWCVLQYLVKMWGWQVVPEGWSSSADPQDHFCPDTYSLPGSWSHLRSKHTVQPWWPAASAPSFPSCLVDSSKGRRWAYGMSSVWGRWVALLGIAEAVAYVVHVVWTRNINVKHMGSFTRKWEQDLVSRVFTEFLSSALPKPFLSCPAADQDLVSLFLPEASWLS